jgi:hypothetical protein
LSQPNSWASQCQSSSANSRSSWLHSYLTSGEWMCRRRCLEILTWGPSTSDLGPPQIHWYQPITWGTPSMGFLYQLPWCWLGIGLHISWHYLLSHGGISSYPS